jgi:hypothetical protein
MSKNYHKWNGARSGKNNPNWKGGRRKSHNGYIYIFVGTDNPLADKRGYAAEHRIVADRKIRRPLLTSEHIHHLNGVRSDNRMKNIQIETNSTHAALHVKTRKRDWHGKYI